VIAWFWCLTYAERLRRLDIPSLELRRLHADLFYCYKTVFGYTDLQASDLFEMAPLSTTRGHIYKLYKKQSSAIVRQKLFSKRIIIIIYPRVLISVLSQVFLALLKMSLSLRT